VSEQGLSQWRRFAEFCRTPGVGTLVAGGAFYLFIVLGSPIDVIFKILAIAPFVFLALGLAFVGAFTRLAARVRRSRS